MEREKVRGEMIANVSLAMNVSLSSLERLLHRYTMESTAKPFDVRSVPIETTPIEPAKGKIFCWRDRDRLVTFSGGKCGNGSITSSDRHGSSGKYLQW